MEAPTDLVVRPDRKLWWRTRRRAARRRISTFVPSVSLLITGLQLSRDGHELLFACFAAAVAFLALTLIYWLNLLYRTFIAVSTETITWRFLARARSYPLTEIAEVTLDDSFPWPFTRHKIFTVHDQHGNILLRFPTGAWSEPSIAALRRALSAQ